MNDLPNSLKKILLDIPLENYFREELPCHYDQKILSLIKAIVESDIKVQECLQSLLSLEDTSKLLIFSKRMASLAIRENSIEMVNIGLYALSYCFKIEDTRDLLVSICLLYASISRLKYSPYDILSKMRFYDLNFKKFLEDFLERDDKYKSLEAFRYSESKDKGGFLYKKKKGSDLEM